MKNFSLKLMFVLCFCGGFSAVAVGQEKKETMTAPQNMVAAQAEAMKKLDFLVGNWRGEGWVITYAGKRETFTNEESVQMKLGGLVAQVEGLGKSKDEKTGAEKVTHNALGILSYDATAKVYRWKTYTMQGYGADTTAEIGNKSFVWGFRMEKMSETRFTITLNDKGNWLEIGEMSRDGGKTWMKFFEMELKKVN